MVPSRVFISSREVPASQFFAQAAAAQRFAHACVENLKAEGYTQGPAGNWQKLDDSGRVVSEVWVD